MTNLVFRTSVQTDDVNAVRELVTKTGFFNAEEISVAGELVAEKLAQKNACSYHFLFAEHNAEMIGYTCYGLIPFTDRRFDLYWIAVDPVRQNHGIGKILLQNTEKLIKEQGGLQVYTETSGRLEYLPTRNFYAHNGYQQVAELLDFYRAGDSKVIYSKNLV